MKQINTQCMLMSLPFFIIIFVLISCDSKKSNRAGYENFQGNRYVDTLAVNGEQHQVRIKLEWGNDVGEITVEEDSAQLPKRIEHYLFRQEDDALILSTEYQDDIDTCYIKHLSNDSIVLVHNNPDVFFTNRNKTVLYRKNM